MVEVKLVIQSLSDAKAGKPLLATMNPDNSEETPLTVAILEKGTKSGATSLMFLLQGKDGKTTYAQCTANHLRMFVSALDGAEARFKEEGGG